MRLYQHSQLKDILLVVHKEFYIKETQQYSLKIAWYRKPKPNIHDGWLLCDPYRVKWPAAKYYEFKLINKRGENNG